MTIKKSEWREIVDVHSIELYKEDIKELGSILTEDTGKNTPEIEMSVTSNSRTLKFNPIDENFDNFDIKSSNQVRIELVIWNGDSNDIVSGVTLEMHRNYVNYQIHSNSETWFLGKIEQLNRFFTKKKPKIEPVPPLFRHLVLINNITIVVGLLLMGFFFVKDRYILSMILSILVILMILIPIRVRKPEDPPYVKLYFYSRPKIESTPKKQIPWNLIIQVLILVVTIIGLFL
jgi:hypothetical protein